MAIPSPSASREKKSPLWQMTRPAHKAAYPNSLDSYSLNLSAQLSKPKRLRSTTIIPKRKKKNTKNKQQREIPYLQSPNDCAVCFPRARRRWQHGRRGEVAVHPGLRSRDAGAENSRCDDRPRRHWQHDQERRPSRNPSSPGRQGVSCEYSSILQHMGFSLLLSCTPSLLLKA